MSSDENIRIDNSSDMSSEPDTATEVSFFLQKYLSWSIFYVLFSFLTTFYFLIIGSMHFDDVETSIGIRPLLKNEE